MQNYYKLFAGLILLSVIFSDTAHSQWVQQSSPTDSILNCIYFLDSNNGHIGGRNTFLSTTNSGSNWLQSSVPVNTEIVSIHFPSVNTGYAIGSAGKRFKTSNGGLNWLTLPDDAPFNQFDIWFINNVTGFTGGASGKLYKTTNGGQNWIEQITSGFLNIRNIQFTSPDTGYISSAQRIWKSTDGGLNWIITPPTNNSSELISMSFSDDNSGYAISQLGTLQKTTDGGQNWITNFGFLPITVYLSIHSVNSAVAYVASQNNGIFATSNGGLNWTAQDIPSFTPKSVCFVNQNTGFTCGFGGKIFKTTNGGGIFTSLISNSNMIPVTYNLYQNYPNPFNPATVIKFDLPGKSFVKLTLLDITGREIAELINETLSAGYHTVEFDGSNFATGVYFYRIIIEGDDQKFSKTLKMILVK